MITSFAGMLEVVKGLKPQRVAVAAAQDDAVLEAVQSAKTQGIADFILVGDSRKIQDVAAKLAISLDGLEIIHEPDERQAALRAVALVSGGQANVLMKGMINTADLLRAVLDKEVGLRTGRVLSHAAVFEIPGFERLIAVTDGGMNIAPSLQQKADIIQNSVDLTRVLGIEPAKVAVLAAVEVVNPDMPATMEAAALAKMAERGQIKGAVVDGPLALDNAVSLEAAKHKGIKSPVAGLADILVVPTIEVGNALGKSLIYFAGARMAGLILGAAKPVVVTSRADTHESKVMSIALGALLGQR
ncbi:MAG: phosphate butyryltransferase [Negativicutes bacterium]|nr:phosphate butyryltransferase [Negativicutes bacterium]